MTAYPLSSFRRVSVATILQETAAAPCCHEGIFFPSVEFDSVRSEQREGVTSRLTIADSAPGMADTQMHQGRNSKGNAGTGRSHTCSSRRMKRHDVIVKVRTEPERQGRPEPLFSTWMAPSLRVIRQRLGSVCCFSLHGCAARRPRSRCPPVCFSSGFRDRAESAPPSCFG